eukprot:TRINITY_DN15681_c0_g1_i1.p2 TRINITY_DN15681_c0_g1~~TRINITY_DN15681_c0_g1_i1.p2  ORF type:complete len:130 (+),score=41.94 TRINITY_DN15681_c0_g1_i1:27-392(+)
MCIRDRIPFVHPAPEVFTVHIPEQACRASPDQFMSPKGAGLQRGLIAEYKHALKGSEEFDDKEIEQQGRMIDDLLEVHTADMPSNHAHGEGNKHGGGMEDENGRCSRVDGDWGACQEEVVQ